MSEMSARAKRRAFCFGSCTRNGLTGRSGPVLRGTPAPGAAFETAAGGAGGGPACGEAGGGAGGAAGVGTAVGGGTGTPCRGIVGCSGGGGFIPPGGGAGVG